jgi:hypothetical protein
VSRFLLGGELLRGRKALSYAKQLVPQQESDLRPRLLADALPKYPSTSPPPKLILNYMGAEMKPEKSFSASPRLCGETKKT